MRTDGEVLRDIKSAPFRDSNGMQILPGHFVSVGLDEYGIPICAGTAIRDGEFTIGGVSIDEVLENYDVIVMGWIQ